MAVRIFYFGILFFLIILNQATYGQGWQDLLIRADSLSDSLDYDSAIFIGNLALQEAEKTSGKISIPVAKAAYQLGEYYLTCCRYSEAESSLKRSLDIRRKILGDDHADVATALDGLGRLYTETCRFPEADSSLKRSLAIRKRLFDEESLEMAETYYSLGLMSIQNWEFTAAESLLVKAKNIREALLGYEHPDVAKCLYKLTVIYRYSGSTFDELKEIGFKALSILSNKLGEKNDAVADCLFHIALIYHLNGQCRDAIVFLDSSLNITTEIYGYNHRNAVECLYYLGETYANLAEFKKSRYYYENALTKALSIFNTDHYILADCMHSYGSYLLYYEWNFAESESLIKNSAEIYERLYGSDDYDLAECLYDLAILYIRQLKLPEAKHAIENALAIWEKFLTVKVPEGLDVLASVYMINSEYDKAEEILEQSRTMQKRTDYKYSTCDRIALGLLASVYSLKGKYAEAESIYEKLLECLEDNLNPDHPVIATNLIDFGLLYLLKSEPENAIPLLQKALGILEKQFDSSHPDVIRALEYLSDARRLLGEHDRALEIAARAYDGRRMNLEKNAIGMSERGALTYLKYSRRSFDKLLTCYAELDSCDENTVNKAAEIILNFKGQISDKIFTRDKYVLNDKDSVSSALLDSIRNIKFQISNSYINQINTDLQNDANKMDSLNSLVENLEALLSRRIGYSGFDTKYNEIKLQKIRYLIPKNAVYIEFLKYKHSLKNLPDYSNRYLAVILSNDSKPLIIELGSAEQTDSIITEYKEHMYRVVRYGLSANKEDQKEYRRINEGIFNNIWRPLKQYINDADLVLIAPDGELNAVSFAGLIDDGGNYLIEKKAIHYVSCARDILKLNDKSKPGKGLFILGNPDFDSFADSALWVSARKDSNAAKSSYHANYNVRSTCSALGGIILNPLPETKMEIESIAALWSKLSDEPVSVYQGIDASEEQFKTEAPGSRVIHLATHGFYIGKSCRMDLPESGLNRFAGWVGENPLLHTGLFLAGANNLERNINDDRFEDGILSAYEVSTMDLQGTELVVLSACESGLGDIQNGEGVYGLRRAFQIAGTRTVISTLWPIMDKTSSEMLSQLYNRQDHSLPETLREIQLKKINELREQNKSDHPASWAPYIILGDWQ